MEWRRRRLGAWEHTACRKSKFPFFLSSSCFFALVIMLTSTLFIASTIRIIFHHVWYCIDNLHQSLSLYLCVCIFSAPLFVVPISLSLSLRDAVSLAQSVRERRRMNRIAEQRRRDALKTSLRDLRSLVPAAKGEDPSGAKNGDSKNGSAQQFYTKSAIIRQTIEYIQYLHGRYKDVRRQREGLEQANLALQKWCVYKGICVCAPAGHVTGRTGG